MDEGGSLRVFISYSHKDESLRDELHAHLAMLVDSGAITAWYDGMILPGDEWSPEILQEIEQADIIILLISHNFLSSKFCRSVAMRRALERHEEHGARVIPVLIRPCDWALAPFARLKGLPKDMKAVTSWDNPDAAWTDVAIGIREVVTFERSNLTSRSPDERAEQRVRGVPAMSLKVSDPTVADGLRTFQLEVRADAVPNEGYVGWQTQLHPGSLRYRMGDTKDEFMWPDAEMAVALRSALPQTHPTWLNHGVLSGLIPPLLKSHYVGPLLRILLQCPESQITQPHVHEVHLVPYSDTNTNGAVFMNEREKTPLETIGDVNIPGAGITGVAASVNIACDP